VDRDPWTNVTGDRHSNSGDLGGYSFVDRTFPAILSCRRTWNQQWIAWAHGKDILEEVTPHLQLEPAERPAQLRFRLGDLAASELGTTIQALCYMHARRISTLNARQMHQVMDQFQLEPQEARRVAEELLGGRMVCPLNGEYELTETGDTPPRWKSTAWQRDSVYLEEEVPDAHSYRYRLHPQLLPKGFDFLAKGRQIWAECGIYQLDGNRLVICCSRQSNSRPVRLDAEPDDVRRLLVLERAEAGDAVAR